MATTNVHASTISTRFFGCYDSSVGFSSLTQDRIVTTSLERDAASDTSPGAARQPWLTVHQTDSCPINPRSDQRAPGSC
jgi:hypothetical protein